LAANNVSASDDVIAETIAIKLAAFCFGLGGKTELKRSPGWGGLGNGYDYRI
jgi:hypothetical protein